MSLPAAAALAVLVSLSASAAPKSKPKAKTAKPAPRPVAAPGVVTGEVANTDIFKGILSLRTGPNAVREFAVTEQTAIEGTTGLPLAFETLKVGDAVEVHSKDGKSAAAVRVRPAP
ncbi:MAG: hypothetical protein HY403_09965 [Elusimicrobia bacterium]|nr:hypothetical protein [Elusimicrobiota bacterium]